MGENVPTLETILALLCVIATAEQAREFTVKHIPGVAGFFSLVHPTEKIGQNIEVGEMLRDRIAFAIFAMAGAAGGTTEETITRRFGEDGVACLRRLLDAGALVKTENGTLRTVCTVEITDTRLLLDLIRHTVDLFDIHTVQESCVMARLHTDGLSEMGVKRLADSIRLFTADVKRIVERHPGPNVLMFGMVSSLLKTSGSGGQDDADGGQSLQSAGA